ncbi:hypothetical protein HUW51_15795 [Adhaeribacter swui]|uniref:Uncharacterized protein n=1 Tax=Adhaeribacter swui TaxID=2086471 RepID=A0A7G7GAC7_9BACT|nr:hypothetical protein [Adhaeribacter swui]QNF34111.1 hypothetical protein HUW51_15795 [Adhaeribacter swui]
MSLANIDLSKFCIVRHRDTDKVYLYEKNQHPAFPGAAEQDEFTCFALDIFGCVNTSESFTFKKENLYLQPIHQKV